MNENIEETIKHLRELAERDIDNPMMGGKRNKFFDDTADLIESLRTRLASICTKELSEKEKEIIENGLAERYGDRWGEYK
jgi:hypothetical protein